ncbi:MAG TPA: rhodanese-like domain-containing protein [Thermoanaerobaculia bacterium]|nr:rhodanese-like domain-containing protein [Thermoanaerobaculia bacterium]
MDPHFDGIIFKTHAAELERRMRYPHPPFVVLDVRPAVERGLGMLPGAMAVSSADLSVLPPGTTAKTEFFVVGSGPYDEEVRRTTLRLRELGAARVVELTGGMSEWESFGHALAPADRGA